MKMQKKPQASQTTFWVVIILIVVLSAILVWMSTGLFSPNGKKFQANGNPLKLPDILEDLNPDPAAAEYKLEIQSGQTNFIGDQMTDTLGYNGTYLGPILRFRQGEQVNIEVHNRLGVSTTLHWHGLIVDGDQDGGPHQGIQPEGRWNPTFVTDQPAATLWYHPHFSGQTANQVFFGLAGLIYIEDEISDALQLPKTYGVDDFPLIVQDRSFTSDGRFDYRTSMMGVVAGDRILINGTVDPFLEVPQSLVRFRLLNASNSQNFEFRMSDGSALNQIAADGGFLQAPLPQKRIFLAPGERAEVVVDFSKASRNEVSLMTGNRSILNLHINRDLTGDFIETLPAELTQIPEPVSDPNRITRVFELQSMGITGTINGKYFDMNRIDEEVRLNEEEIWIVRNVGGMMQSEGHPFHVHGTQFRVLSRDGEVPPPEERGFKDTVFVEVGEEVRILVRFTHPGIFMYHCHILEHEDNGMMGQFRVE